MKTFNAMKTWGILRERLEKLENDDSPFDPDLHKLAKKGLQEYPKTAQELKDSMKKIVDRAREDLKKRKAILDTAIKVESYVNNNISNTIKELFEEVKNDKKELAISLNERIMDNVDQADDLVKNLTNEYKKSEKKRKNFFVAMRNFIVRTGLGRPEYINKLTGKET